ncbi:hypothetical protein AAE478_002929 [Parahypoxylon ruwenzoriense]
MPFDLIRIVLPGYNFPLAPALAHAPPGFKARCQRMCVDHANSISQLLRDGSEYGTECLDDYFTATAVFESTKTQVVFVTTLARGNQTLYNRVFLRSGPFCPVLASRKLQRNRGHSGTPALSRSPLHTPRSKAVTRVEPKLLGRWEYHILITSRPLASHGLKSTETKAKALLKRRAGYRTGEHQFIIVLLGNMRQFPAGV